MKIGFVFSVYDELTILKENLRIIGRQFPVVVIQSDPARSDLLLGDGHCLHWRLMPDLAPSVESYMNERKSGGPSDIPARAVTRNYSVGFSLIRNEQIDYVVALLGDVRITSLQGIRSIIAHMKYGGYKVAATRAVGQYFYDTKGELKRLQTFDTNDIMPQFFIVDAHILRSSYFCDIKVTNRFTTEQCLGDEVIRYCNHNSRSFHEVCYVISDKPYPRSIKGVTYNPDKAGHKGWRRISRLSYRALKQKMAASLPERFQAPIKWLLAIGRWINLRAKQLLLNGPEQRFALVQKGHYRIIAPDSVFGIIGNYAAHETYPYEGYLLQYVNDGSSQEALDFGCGPGRMIRRMAKFFKRVDGVDISETLLEVAREWVREVSPAPYLFLNDGITMEGVPSDSYDFIYSTIALQHIPVYRTRMRIFQEFRRVSRVRGRIALQMAYSERPRQQWPKHAEWYDNRWTATNTNGACDVIITPNSISDVEKTLNSAGFGEVKIHLAPVPHEDDCYTHWIFVHALRLE